MPHCFPKVPAVKEVICQLFVLRVLLRMYAYDAVFLWREQLLGLPAHIYALQPETIVSPLQLSFFFLDSLFYEKLIRRIRDTLLHQIYFWR